MNGSPDLHAVAAGMTSPISLHDPLNSHFIVSPGSLKGLHRGGDDDDDEQHDGDDQEDAESDDDDDLHIDVHSDGDTASQRSISLDSPSRSLSQYTHSRTTSIDLNDDSPSPSPSNPPSLSQTQPLSLSRSTPATPDPTFTPVSLIRQGLSQTRQDSYASKRTSHPYTLDTDLSSDQEQDDRSSFMRRLGASPVSSIATSLYDGDEREQEDGVKAKAHEAEQEQEQDVIVPARSFGSSLPNSARSVGQTPTVTTPSSYPPPPLQKPQRPSSFASASSHFSSSTTYSKKARPESMLVSHTGPLVLGIALVDFNHLVGPKIEFSRGEVFEEDEEMVKILPFLALPDGAHLVSP